MKTIREWYRGGSSNTPAARLDQQDWVDCGAPLFGDGNKSMRRKGYLQTVENDIGKPTAQTSPSRLF
jgi:hypothetical protein